MESAYLYEMVRRYRGEIEHGSGRRKSKRAGAPMPERNPTRREFFAGLTLRTGGLALAARSGMPDPGSRAGVELRIGPVQLEIAKGRTIQTTGYNESVPGPIVRLREGVPVVVELVNETNAPELVHWHGLVVP